MQKETDLGWQDLSVLKKDERGKYAPPLSPNPINLNERIKGDANKFADSLNGAQERRGVLKIEIREAESVDGLLAGAKEVVKKIQKGSSLTNNDFEQLASYLDWSYQQQVGIPANQSNIVEAMEKGIGARDTLVLFRNIKNKLDGNN